MAKETKIKRRIFIISLLLLVLVFTGCNQPVQKEYVCSDGSIVSNSNQCTNELAEKVDLLEKQALLNELEGTTKGRCSTDFDCWGNGAPYVQNGIECRQSCTYSLCTIMNCKII